MTSLAHAAALGVDAVKVLMPWDVPAQERAARSKLIGEVIVQAEPFGLPVMVEPICLAAPRLEDATQIEADGARMAAELGADIIKIMAPNDPSLLTDWTRELGVPIVILGGPAAGTPEELLEMVEGAIAAGASGITIGRRVWQRPLEQATDLLARLTEVVHPERAV
jgi:class I fructose-bisphosphate aldolase